jgi:membrane protein YdbS with pleckstrin-like domain
MAAYDHPMPATFDLRPPDLLVHRRAVWYWALRAASGWLVFGGSLFALTWWGPELAGEVVGRVWPAVLAIAVAHTVGMPLWRYRVHRYQITEEAVYTQSGWVSQERRIAPLARIQTIDTRRGPLQQVLRLTTITITTASAAGSVQISGLDVTGAEALVTRLTRRAAAAEGDAT